MPVPSGREPIGVEKSSFHQSETVAFYMHIFEIELKVYSEVVNQAGKHILVAGRWIFYYHLEISCVIFFSVV